MTMTPYWRDPHDLIAGECFLEDIYGYAPEPGLVQTVSCDLMEWEYIITDRVTLEGHTLPPPDTIRAIAAQRCDPLWSELLIPDQRRWDEGDRAFACMATREAFR